MDTLTQQPSATVNLWEHIADTASYHGDNTKITSSSSSSSSLCFDDNYLSDRCCGSQSISMDMENQLIFMTDVASEKDDVMELQSALLESAAAANHQREYNSNMPNDNKPEIVVNSPVSNTIATASTNDSSPMTPMKTTYYQIPDIIGSWADVESSSDEEILYDDNNVSEVSTNINAKKHNHKFSVAWTAWYDPPLGKDARNGISKQCYEENLINMGEITCSEELWTIQDTIDWDNLPPNSTVSFSVPGSKPYWEDPIHAQGGRWIVKGFNRLQSETLFIKAVLSLFLNHLPDFNEITCLSLQVKNPKRGNSLLLWTKTTNYSYASEFVEFLQCLIEDDTLKNKNSTRNARKNNKKRASKKNLSVHFCPNIESIERNAVKLEGGFLTDQNKKKIYFSTEGIASKCDAITEMYSQGRKKRRKRKLANKFQCCYSNKINNITVTNPADTWRFNGLNNQKRVFLRHSDINSSINDEDLVFVDFQPELIGWTSCGHYDSKGCWYPPTTPSASTNITPSFQPWNNPRNDDKQNRANSTHEVA